MSDVKAAVVICVLIFSLVTGITNGIVCGVCFDQGTTLTETIHAADAVVMIYAAITFFLISIVAGLTTGLLSTIAFTLVAAVTSITIFSLHLTCSLIIHTHTTLSHPSIWACAISLFIITILSRLAFTQIGLPLNRWVETTLARPDRNQLSTK